MHFYGQDYWSVLKWPLKTFWSMQRQIGRIRAETDQRAMLIASSSQNPEGAKKLGEQFEAEVGVPVVVEKKFDASKFEELKKKLKKSA